MEVKRRRQKSTNLVKGWRQNRHKKSIVDVTNELVSDVRVGHLGIGNMKSHISQSGIH